MSSIIKFLIRPSGTRKDRLWAVIVVLLVMGAMYLGRTFAKEFLGYSVRSQLSSKVDQLQPMMANYIQTMLNGHPELVSGFAIMAYVPKEIPPCVAQVDGAPALYTIWLYDPAFKPGGPDGYLVGIYSKGAVPGATVTVSDFSMRLQRVGRAVIGIGTDFQKYNGPDIPLQTFKLARHPVGDANLVIVAAFDSGKSTAYGYVPAVGAKGQ